MKSSISKAVQGTLALMAVCLTAALLVPGHPEAPKISQSVSPLPLPAEPAEQSTTQWRASPEAIFSLFHRKKIFVPGLHARPAPVPAPFLNFLGYYTGFPGTPCYMLKDTRTGRVITLSKGSIANGWSLVTIDDNRITVQNLDGTYTVERR